MEYTLQNCQAGSAFWDHFSCFLFVGAKEVNKQELHFFKLKYALLYFSKKVNLVNYLTFL